MIILLVLLIPLALLILARVANRVLLGRCKSNVCMIGRTVIVTGGNSGIGLELSKALAARGSKIIILDKDNATETVKAIATETHNPHIYFRQVDLTKPDDIRRVADDLNRNLREVHVLVNNAGLIDPCDGKQTMEVNYLGHFLLTHLLSALLMKSAPSRIIFASSWAAYTTSLLPREPTTENMFEQTKAYEYSKQAVAAASRVFAAKLTNTGVTSNCYHPDVVKSNLWRYGYQGKFDRSLKFYLWWIYAITFGRTTEEGMQTPLYLSIADEVQDVSGQFFMECRKFLHPLRAYNQEICRNLWKFSERIVSLQDYEKLDHVVKSMQK